MTNKKTDNLRILVTNDDGIYAPGLAVMERIARTLSDDIWVVAPEIEQSGAGHSLSLNVPLRYQEHDPRRFSVKGTPTDCVLFAIEELLGKQKKKVDLVLSGVNRGSNVGEDVTHSGTLAAAMEGTLCGIPSIGFSQAFSMWDAKAAVPWATAEKYAPEIIRKILKQGVPKHIFINVNFPDLPAEKVKGVVTAPQGRRTVGKALDARMDAKGRPYFWIHWLDKDEKSAPGSDISRLDEGYITVTPLCLDLTDYKLMETLRETLEQ